MRLGKYRDHQQVIAGLAVGAALLALVFLLPGEASAFSSDHHLIWDELDELYRCLGSPINCSMY